MDDVTSNLIDKLEHKMRCRAIMRKLELNSLEGVIEVINEVIQEKKAEELAQQKRLIEQQAALDKINAIMAEAGLSKDDLQAVKKPYHHSKTNKQKYAVTDSEGNVRYWSGMGYKPKQFAQAMTYGYTKEEMLAEANLTLPKPFETLQGCEKLQDQAA